ncbi:MAG: class I SAM-dependent methyltransferase [Candidatus Peregrinibacteria bacterium]|nr:class I SAM-dependent methyltransferase [Candidatus Peregrinibacteria bacterium]
MRVFQPDRFLLNEFVGENAKLLTGSLLDVGGWDGKRYRGHFKHVEKYTVLDPEPKVNPDIVATAEKIPLPDASVDSVLCTEVLMDVYPIHEAIAEIARVLKPGGHFLGTVSFMSPLCDEPYHFWRFTPYSLQNLFEPYFTDIRIERRGGYRTQKSQNWIRFWIERLDLYKHPILGRLFSLVSKIRGHRAMAADERDKSEANRKYTLGYNIFATRKQSQRESLV